jgi:nicotinamide-nucleotide amidase
MNMTDPVIEIVIVGNEILADPGRDSNSRHMTAVLAREGYGIDRITVAGDTMAAIGDVLSAAAKRADVVLVTGGLGPTSDDLTIEAAAKAFGLPLILDEGALRHIEDLFRRRARAMSESNRKQAFIPRGAEALENPHGTAPGVCITVGKALFIFMPGVPSEMVAIFDGGVLPRLREQFAPQEVTTASLQVTGITESGLYDRISAIPGVRETARFYPKPEGITVQIVAPADSGFDAGSLAEQIACKLRNLVYSRQGETLEEVVGSLLAGRNLTIATAESCTGGLIADRLTNVAGSSRYFMLGAVTYSNESKVRVLGVDSILIERNGAVSEPVAKAMAEGVRVLAGTDIGLATTGIAGPGGGSSEKPVGLMYTALAYSGGTIIKRLQFGEERRINKGRMSQSALDMVRYFIEGYESNHENIHCDKPA